MQVYPLTQNKAKSHAALSSGSSQNRDEYIIDLRQVVKTYETPSGPFTALQDINLPIKYGQFVAVVGKSGSGKTTLLNLLAGIDRPTSGGISVDGTQLDSLSESQLAEWRGRTIGLVFQFFQLLPTLAAKWIAFFDEVYDTYRQSGVTQAMHQFATVTLGSEESKVLARNMKLHTNEQNLANARYWMEHGLRQYPRVELDLDTLATHTRQLVLVGGRDSQDQMTYQPSKVLAQKLGLEIVNLPGGHLGFMAYPAEFAQILLDVLKG